MKELQEKILKEGTILPNNIVKVDSFLNHQIDVNFIDRLGEEFYSKFKNKKITKVLTIEASGISIACAVAKKFNVKVVFAKKGKRRNLLNDFYVTEVMSYTHNEVYDVYVAKNYLMKSDSVLIIDDFLANGAAINGLINLVNMAGATCVGCGIAIEKGFQSGGKVLREKGIIVESLAIIDKIDEKNQEIVFRGEQCTM